MGRAAGRLPAALASLLVTATLVVVAPGLPAGAAPMPPVAQAPDAEPAAGWGDHPAAPDAASAAALAQAGGEPVEIADQTTESQRRLANPDGTVTHESYVVPQRVRKPAGWVPVDPTLGMVDGRVAPAATVLDLSLSAGGTDELLVLTDGARRLGLSWPTPLPAPVRSGDTATYPDVLPDVDLVVRAEVDSFAMALVVRTRAAAQNPALSRIEWQLSTRGLAPRVAADGAVELVDAASGEVVFAAPPSLMWDSPPPRDPAEVELEAQLGEPLAGGGAERGPGRVVPMPVELSATQRLAVLPDPAMLAAEETRFPVWIDPSFSRAVTNWAPVFASQPGTSWPSGTSQPRDHAKVGNLDWPGCGSWCGRWRSHFRFTISAMAGEQLVANPSFRITLEHSASCNATPVSLWRTASIGSSVTWNSGDWLTDFGDRSANANKGDCGSQPDVSMEWANSTIRGRLQDAMDAGNETFTFGLRAPSESDRFQWKRFDAGSARLVATYNSPPLTPDQLRIDSDCYLQCSSPAVVRSLRPFVTARVRDPHGAPLEAEFQLQTSSGSAVTSGTASSVNSGGTARWRPGSSLSQETTYRFRVRASNQHLTGPWSGFFTLTLDTNPPNIPTVSSGLYRPKDSGTWNGGVGQPGSFTFDPAGSNDVIEYRYRWLNGSETAVPVSEGASHNLNLVPPSDLEQVLQVRSIDHAGNISGWRSYAFYVRPQPSDVAYWKFDEGTGTEVAPATGSEGYAGLLKGGAGWAPSGINPADPAASGTAVSLNGSTGYVEMPRVLTTNHAAGWTVTAWVNPTSLTGYHTIVAQDGAVHNMFRLYYRPIANGGNGGWCFGVRDQDTTESAVTTLCAPADQLRVGQWTHLAAVYDAPAGKLRLWVDGGPNNGEPQPGWTGETAAPPAWAATGAFQVGRARTSPTGWADYWHGQVDEVRAHQRVLGEFELQHVFLQCRYASCPNVPPLTEPVLISQWDLDEGAGPTAADSSGLGNHAALRDGAQWTPDGHGGTPAVRFGGDAGWLETEGQVLVADQPFTVSAWVKLDQLAADEQWFVHAYGGEGGAAFKLYRSPTANSWRFAVVSPQDSWRIAVASSAPAVGTWTHLVGVFDSTRNEVRIYVNGVLQNTVTGAVGQPVTSELLIGGSSTGNFSAGGTIDEVRAYQTALTGAQVAALFTGTGP